MFGACARARPGRSTRRPWLCSLVSVCSSQVGDVRGCGGRSIACARSRSLLIGHQCRPPDRLHDSQDGSRRSNDRRLGAVHRLAAPCFALTGRAPDGTEAAEDAAVAWLRPQDGMAAGAFVEELTGIGRHRRFLREAAARARHDRGENAGAHGRGRSGLAKAAATGPRDGLDEARRQDDARSAPTRAPRA